MTNKPFETIITISRENVFLRWTVLILAISIAAMTALYVKRPPQPAWLINESGKIMVDDKEVFAWQPAEMLRRAFEVMFVPSENRDSSLEHYFIGQPLEAAKNYKPDSRFTNFKLESQDISSNGNVIVIGTILRESKKDLRLSIELLKTEKSSINPIGLKISSTTIISDVSQ